MTKSLVVSGGNGNGDGNGDGNSRPEITEM